MMSFLLTILFQNHINEPTNEFYVLSLFIIQYWIGGLKPTEIRGIVL